MKKYLFIVLISFGTLVRLFPAGGIIRGIITDAESKESLIGATVILQGTSIGAVTDFEGAYILSNISPGKYNLVCTYVSYEQHIIAVDVMADAQLTIDILLKPASIILDEVVIKKSKKNDTEIALLSSLKVNNLIVNGISAQQISRTQDKDAAEIVRRVPGITITDGKFVIVRGLMERYNSILLNGVTAPSFEANSKAFSLDVIPSNMIENILIYKSPAPELPADFAGAVINIVTKQNADKNELKFSYALGYKENVSFNDKYQTYEGGKLDWLGFDDGTRAIPSSTPSTSEFQDLYVWDDLDAYYSKMNNAVALSKDYNTTWTTENYSPFLDQSFSTNLLRRFTLGKMSFGNITSLTYKYDNSYYKAKRREYENYDVENDTFTYDFDYTDIRSKHAANIGLIHNWLMVFGNNQRIEFRNFLNNVGESSNSLREGIYHYNTEYQKSVNLRFKKRFIYTGQLAGKHGFTNNSTFIDWVAGYSLTQNDEPDDRKIKYARDQYSSDDPFYFKTDKEVNINQGGRLYQNLNENSYNAVLNFQHDFNLFSSDQTLQLKAGGLYEYKTREFTVRQLGIVAPRGTQNLALNTYLPPEELLVTDNFYIDAENVNSTGFTYKDGSSENNNYSAATTNLAGYIALKIPITRYASLYGGVRTEKYDRNDLDAGTDNSDTLAGNVTLDTINFFPSATLSFKITENHILRFSYGKTLNRPEFRELEPVVYEDFDLNALVHGNALLTSSYIDNYDIRYEWYPSPGELISLSAFYKKFINPIEMFLYPAGTGYDYVPFNTEEAYSKGLELDIRKTLSELSNALGPLSYLKDLTIVFNTSYIVSEINTNKPFAREKNRVMQGQSPYIINLGMYYDNAESGTKVNFSYNRIGKRIVFAGSPSNPHTWELPRNSLDINLSQKIGKRVEVAFGIKDLINNPVKLVQYYGENDEIEAMTNEFVPNRKFTVGVSVTL